MKRYLSTAAVAAICVCAAVPAFGDDGGTSGVSIRIGGFSPQQSATRDAGGDTWFAAGVDYKLGTIGSAHYLGKLSLSLDYAGKGDFRNMPVMLNYTSGNTYYWSVGAGAGFTRFPEGAGNVNDKVRFAYSGALGFNFNPGQFPMFVELRYLGNDQPRVGGYGLYVGVRF